MKKLMAIWVVGVVASISASIHNILVSAEPTNIALAVFAVFWLFGFWVCALPLYKLYRVRKLYKTVKNREDLQKFVANSETRELGVQVISKELGVPDFLAEKLYKVVESKISESQHDVDTVSSDRKAA